MINQPPAMVTPVLPGVPLHPTVDAALRATGGRARSVPVDTRDVLIAVMRADSPGAWDRLRLHAGDADAVAGMVVIDPDTRSGYCWENIPLTHTCAAALVVAWHLASRYDIWPIPVGILAIGLVADDSSAATRALCDHGLAREELLDIIQSDILGVRLSGLDTILPSVLRQAQSPPPAARSAPAPVAVSPAPDTVDPGYWRRRRQADIAVLVAAALMILGLSVAYAILHDPAPKTPSKVHVSMGESTPMLGPCLDHGETAVGRFQLTGEQSR